MTFLQHARIASARAAEYRREQAAAADRRMASAKVHRLAHLMREAEEIALEVTLLGAPNDARLLQTVKAARAEIAATRRAMKGQGR